MTNSKGLPENVSTETPGEVKMEEEDKKRKDTYQELKAAQYGWSAGTGRVLKVRYSKTLYYRWELNGE